MTTGIVIAGGKGKRFGGNKACAVINNKTLLEIVTSKLSKSVKKLFIVTSREQYKSILDIGLPYNIITDIIPGKSAIGGVYTGLIHSESDLNIIVACDMPLINADLISYMIDTIEDFDAITTRKDDIAEPLHAVYRKSCCINLRDMIENNNLSLHKLFNKINVKYLTEKEVEIYDPEHLSTFNINTKEDFSRVEKLLRDTVY